MSQASLWPRSTRRGFQGRILYLCKGTDSIRAQLRGQRLTSAAELVLLDNVSTDEIIPAWACFYYDDLLGRYALVGLRGGAVEVDSLRNAGVAVLVSGHEKGCGSSRETAPYAERAAGISVVFARSFAKIYRQNCSNLGVFTSTDFELLARLERGYDATPEELAQDLDPLSRSIVLAGGLLAWQHARRAELSAFTEERRERPEQSHAGVGAQHPPDKELARNAGAQTFVEKVLAQRARGLDGERPPRIEPGQPLLLMTDLRFSHDYTTAMAAAQFREGYGADARVSHPESVLAFRDHLLTAASVMSDEKRRLGLDARVTALEDEQREFCARQGIRLIDAAADEGIGGICHNVLVEEVAEPGQVIAGTDSHACTSGAVGAFAFGVGSTDIALAWATGLVRVTVPESVRVELTGQLRAAVCAKDIMLALLADSRVRSGVLREAVIEFVGDALVRMSLDERATLTNMAVEAGAFTAVALPDAELLASLAAARRVDVTRLARGVLLPDPGATYRATLTIDASGLSPMVACPGDPHNGLPLRELLRGGRVPVDIAYGGSCTGGKAADMDMYAAVFASAVAAGRGVASGVQCFIQFGSRRVRDYADRMGYTKVFQAAGVRLLAPGCGACIGAGPGISGSREQVTVSAINRNYPGRSGPGRVYLASPYVVAASSITGYLTDPESLVAEARVAPPNGTET